MVAQMSSDIPGREEKLKSRLVEKLAATHVTLVDESDG